MGAHKNDKLPSLDYRLRFNFYNKIFGVKTEIQIGIL
jgi:hypothetical protein